MIFMNLTLESIYTLFSKSKFDIFIKNQTYKKYNDMRILSVKDVFY
jgi:hypothetical protein